MGETVDVERVQQLLVEATVARNDRLPTGEIVGRLAGERPDLVLGELEHILDFQVDAAWQIGWQPAELVRRGRLSTSSAAAGRLMKRAVSIDAGRRPASTLDPRWLAQLAALDLPLGDARPGWVPRWRDEERLDLPGAIDAAIEVLVAVTFLPPLDALISPPGAASGVTWSPKEFGDPAGPEGVNADPHLDTIRHLLAKAESSEFEAEATAFTAKAQELMTRHAIDAAALVAERGQSDHAHEQPVATRVPVEAPYVDAKSMLLQVVAEACRCRTVFHAGLDMSTIVGFAADVAAVEMIFTSLLVQAQTAMADAARHAPPGDRVRGQSYRSAFLWAFTDRVGDRLREVNDTVVSEMTTERGTAFVPILRSRSAVVDEFMERHFAATVVGSVRAGHDAAGSARGRLAAESAHLARGDVEGA